MIWSLLFQMGGTTSGWWSFAFLGLLIVGTVVYLLWNATGGPSPTPSTGRADAVETLRMQYAHGEIDDEEFEKGVRTLRER